MDIITINKNKIHSFALKALFVIKHFDVALKYILAL